MLLNRVYRDDKAVQEEVGRFLQELPDSLAHVYTKIPEEKLVIYERDVLSQPLAHVQEYLGEA